MKLRYYLIFQCPILHKAPITGGVWVVSGGVCLVSGMCLRTEEVSGCSNTKSIGKIWIRPYLDIALSSSTLYCKNVYVWGCLDGVWGCLDDVQMVSEGVWGGINTKSVGKNYVKLWYSDITFSFNALYCIKMSYILRCLYCVWECLGEVWWRLGMY